jgi:hypothetical protein
MSTATSVIDKTNQRMVNYDLTKLFLGGTRTIKEEITAGADIAVGTILDRVTATGALIPYDSTTGGNNRIPVGIIMESIANGANRVVTICVRGDVDAGELIFARAGDTLETVVAGQKVKDHLVRTGIFPLAISQMSEHDNS